MHSPLKKQEVTVSAESFKPFIPASQFIPEFTLRAAILGVLFSLLFGATTVYLGLKLGLTISASIPIAVLSIMILKKFGRSTILENNIVQTIGSAGEAIAGGVIFTIPALIFMGYNLEYWRITAFALCGGWLGVLFMIPLRRALIVKEHGILPYPEGTACADILVAGEKGGEMAKRVFQGVGFAMVYKFFMSILMCWKDVVTWTSQRIFPAMTATIEVSPELLGVGYIIGSFSACIMAAGGILAWMFLIPLIKLFGSHSVDIIPPGAIPISEMTPHQIWHNYVRYIGAGAVVVGGLYNLTKSIPIIVEAFAKGFKSFSASRATGTTSEGDTRPRTERDMPDKLVLGGSAAIIFILWIFLSTVIHTGHLGSNFVAAVLMVIFGFFFVTVSSRIVGTIGTTNNPISGDTIATLMLTCLLFVLAGWTGGLYNVVALSVGAVICIAAANAGTTAQDLKTGYIVGATPKSQQLGLMLGVTFSAFIIGGTLLFMNKAFRKYTPLSVAVSIPAAAVTSETISYGGKTYNVGIIKEGLPEIPAGRYAVNADGTAEYSYLDGIGGEKLPAPQARLMSVVIDGILTQKLPWAFLIAGGVISFTMILCGINQVLSFAVGVYLPMSSTLPILVGGGMRMLLKYIRARKRSSQSSDADEGETGGGPLFSSGLVAGGSLGGILVAAVAFLAQKPEWPSVSHYAAKMGEIGPKLLGGMSESRWLPMLAFGLMTLLLIKIATKKIDDKSSN